MLQYYLNMGGYGMYIWPSYGLALGIFLGVTLWACKQHKLAKTTLSRLKEHA